MANLQLKLYWHAVYGSTGKQGIEHQLGGCKVLWKTRNYFVTRRTMSETINYKTIMIWCHKYLKRWKTYVILVDWNLLWTLVNMVDMMSLLYQLYSSLLVIAKVMIYFVEGRVVIRWIWMDYAVIVLCHQWMGTTRILVYLWSANILKLVTLQVKLMITLNNTLSYQLTIVLHKCLLVAAHVEYMEEHQRKYYMLFC